MTKKHPNAVYFGIGAVLVIVVIANMFKRNSQNTSNPLSDTSETFCKPENLESTITLEGATGTTYGNLTLKNIGDKACDVDGRNYIDVRYDLRTVQNLNLNPQGNPETNVFHLEPKQILYSAIQYPNGAQCGVKSKAINVLYAYRVTNTREVVFKLPDGTPTTLQVCENTNKTDVKIWPLSTSEIQM